MAEWMMFGALRNSTDVFWQGSWQGDPSQEFAALTRPEELADWMTQSAIRSSVQDYGKWATNPGIPNAMDLKPWEGTDIALRIHLNLIAKSTVIKANPAMFVKPNDNILMRQFPNHWVVLLNEIVTDVKQENVGFTIWTWGGTMVLSAPKQVFLKQLLWCGDCQALSLNSAVGDPDRHTDENADGGVTLVPAGDSAQTGGDQ